MTSIYSQPGMLIRHPCPRSVSHGCINCFFSELPLALAKRKPQTTDVKCVLSLLCFECSQSITHENLGHLASYLKRHFAGFWNRANC